MLKRTTLVLCLMFSSVISSLACAGDKGQTNYVQLNTSAGEIVLRLRPDRAPVTVANFEHYVREGFYNGTIFHRVIPGFMIQGGGFKPGLERKETGQPITNESDNGLHNDRATIAMARTADPDSATSQFFINLVNNHYLDGKQGRPGYAVFGKVIRGMGVVDAIAKVPTTTKHGFQNVPEKPVVIESARMVNRSVALGKSSD